MEYQFSSYHIFSYALLPKAPSQEKQHQKYRKVLPKLQLLGRLEVFLTTIKIIFLGFNLWMLLPNVYGQEAKRYEIQILFPTIALYIWQPIHVGGKEVVFIHPLWQQNHCEFYLVGIFVISSAYQFDHCLEFTHLVKMITKLWSEFHSLPLDFGIFVMSSAYQFDHSSEFTHLVKMIHKLWSEFHSTSRLAHPEFHHLLFPWKIFIFSFT